MFFVINKEKVYAYFVSILTIVALFFMSSVMSPDLVEIRETSTNIETKINQVNNLINNNTILEENTIK